MTAWVTEALELRHGDAGDPEGPITAQEEYDVTYLRRVRQRSDRVDELLAKITRARGRLRRAEAQAKFEAEQAYDRAQVTNASQRTREFVTARERNAEASLDSLEERLVAHTLARHVSVAEECYEVIKGIHWSLNAIRNDVRASIHNLQFESNLER